MNKFALSKYIFFVFLFELTRQFFYLFSRDNEISDFSIRNFLLISSKTQSYIYKGKKTPLFIVRLYIINFNSYIIIICLVKIKGSFEGEKKVITLIWSFINSYNKPFPDSQFDFKVSYFNAIGRATQFNFLDVMFLLIYTRNPPL